MCTSVFSLPSSLLRLPVGFVVTLLVPGSLEWLPLLFPLMTPEGSFPLVLLLQGLLLLHWAALNCAASHTAFSEPQ